MGWEDAVVFEAVAAELSFTRAARRLHMSQPAVTKRVGRLEQQLDVRLLWRTTRRLAVTDAGHVVLGGIAEMRAEWSSVTQRLAWMLEEAVPPGSDDVTAQVRPIRRLPDLAVLPRWEDASAVQAVTEDGSFARAAVRLRTTRPALSQRVRRLERRLGTGVFDRSAQGLRPTAAGRVLLDGMNAALSVWERIESDVRRLAPARSLSPDSHAPASTSAKPATTPQQSRAQNIPFRDAASQDTVRGNKDTADGGGTPVQAMPRPAQLPADAAVFTGRTAALARLDRLLDAAAPAVVISTIDGSAGVGKTALAVHWAHRVRTWFPDGQLFLDLRGYSGLPPVRSVDALAVFLRSLGVPADQVPTGEQEAAALYRSLLADRRVLVVLDNAATVQQVRPLLPGGGDSLVLVTSRDRLGGLVARDGARRLNLDVLTAQEARAMLASVLGAERVLVDPDAVAGLIEACAYLPPCIARSAYR
jgi:hypothetical protein